jgi:hypothetical protein
MRVKRTNRIGFTPGCWRITRAQAKALCGGTLPRCGYEREVKAEPGHVWNEARTVQFPTTFRAWVVNISNAEFRLRDENGIVGVTEV